MQVKICSLSEISEEGTIYRFEVDEHRIIIVKLSGIYFAADSTCTHEEADLSLGILNDDILMCPLHQARFNIRSGNVVAGPHGDDPATIPPLRTYQTRIEKGELFILT